MPQTKPLAEMSADEVAQLTPEQFQSLAGEHNDERERAEKDFQRYIDQGRNMTDEHLQADRIVMEDMDAVRGLSETERRRLNSTIDEQVYRYKEQTPAGLKDKELEAEIQRLSGRGYGITGEEIDRLRAAKYEQAQREHQHLSTRETLLEKLQRESREQGRPLEVKLESQPEQTMQRTMQPEGKDRW